MGTSMNDCDRIGIGGGCGFDCRVFLRGECTVPDEVADGASPEDRELYKEIYGE
jgi:hypothetical protein